MKRFITVLSSLLVLPAFAEVAPVYYDEVIEYTDDVDEDANEELIEQAVRQNVALRPTINRSTSVSRVAPASTNSKRNTVPSRAMAARTTKSRAAATTNVINRSASARPASRASVTSRSSSRSSKPVTARVGTSNNSVMAGTRATIGSATAQQVLNDSGNSLYNGNTARVSARRGMARLSTSVVAPASSAPVISQEEVSTTTTNLTAIAELTDYCKAQYAACMDNYCNVLDDNQGRCSCSKNIKSYEKAELALETASEQFQDVVQKIKYIGLTGPQIESLFAETEAELAMKDNSDSSNLKTSLDAIKRKIVDVSTPNASSYTPTSGLSIDMSGLLSFDTSMGFDLSSFLGSANNTNTNSVSNQRGEQLYKTATNRCKTSVLNSCVAQGIDANVITNSYDLEIDKQCIAYERSLNDANREMKANVTNAANILQQARLMLAQNKNSYDLRGCVAAIDSCMQDEYVCGSDYELCLDSTGKYISGGEIIPGSMPGVAGGANKNPAEYTLANDAWTSEGMYDLYASWNYTGKIDSTDTAMNAWGSGNSETLGDYIDEKVTNWKSKYTDTAAIDSDMATFLLKKIGYIDPKDTNKVHGMCASVMKQCQDYTFDKDGKYLFDNEVIRRYLEGTLTKIKLQQDNLLHDHAENCKSDVSSCLSTNGYDTSKSSTSSMNTQAINACSLQIATCMSVTGYKPSDRSKLDVRAMANWTAATLSESGIALNVHLNGTLSSYPHCGHNGTCSSATYVSPELTDKDTWGTSFQYGDVIGASVCTQESATANTVKSGDIAYDLPLSGSVGTCWCKITMLAGQSYTGRWVSLGQKNSCPGTGTDASCAYSCSKATRDDETFRTLLYGI